MAKTQHIPTICKTCKNRDTYGCKWVPALPGNPECPGYEFYAVPIKPSRPDWDTYL